jgi:hypothetical protein
MRTISWIAFVLWLAIAMIILVVCIQTIRDFAVLTSISRVVTAALSAVFSVGIFRLAIGYGAFHDRGEDIDRKASLLLSETGLDSFQVAKLMGEYHVARSQSPHLPTWLWKLRRSDLDALWKKYQMNDRA